MRPHADLPIGTSGSCRNRSKILVIKLSSLGDLIQVLGAFRAIRDHHRNDRMILLTTEPYVELARESGWFDEIWVDERAPWWRPDSWLRLRNRLLKAGISRVYDLQRQDRTGWYFRLLAPKPPEWVGIVRGCSHRYVDPQEPLHIMERHTQMLALAGIDRVPPPDPSFAARDVSHFGLAAPYALLVPGSSPHRLVKRWPGERYIELAQSLAANSITPVLIGGLAEESEFQKILAACSVARRVTTSLGEIIGLARDALCAVGNDTGPIHLIAASGCPVIALFSDQSDPIKARPPGPVVTILRSAKLTDLTVSDVLDAVQEIRREPLE